MLLNRISFGYRRRIIGFKRYIISHWLRVTTVLICCAALLVFLFSDGPNTANEYGDFLAGFAGSLAFLWLVASFSLQRRELALQREELALQREEFSAMNKIALYDHVRLMIESCLEQVAKHPANTLYKEKKKIENLYDIFNLYIYGGSACSLGSSLDPEAVEDYCKRYFAYDDYMRYIVTIFTNVAKFIVYGDDRYVCRGEFNFLEENSEKLSAYPYFSAHYGVLCALADGSSDVYSFPRYRYELQCFARQLRNKKVEPKIEEGSALDLYYIKNKSEPRIALIENWLKEQKIKS